MPGTQDIRCFIALEVPRVIQSQLGQLINELKVAGADVKWVDPNNIHLTLKFLGEISPKQVAAVSAQFEHMKGLHHRTPAQLTGLGAFPDMQRPRVIWAGLELAPAIGALFSDMEERMRAIGFPHEQRCFAPHLTLGRVRSPRNLLKLAQRIAGTGVASAQFKMATLTLFQSTLTPAGSIYQPLTTIGLE